MIATDKIWMNGEPWTGATPRFTLGPTGCTTAQACSRASAATTPRAAAVFRLTDHVKRLDASAKLLYMDLPYSVEEIRDACLPADRRQRAPECYLRPFAFYGYGELGVSTAGIPSRS